MSERRTIRRYAHEMYPHAEEGETRALAVEVPYLYAKAVGLNVWGTGWYDDKTDAGRDRDILRHIQLIAARHMALVADALLQGMAGQEAWEWADLRAWDETGEWVYERAMHYGVPVERIKPYPCGPEPDRHDHMASTGDVMGDGIITRIDCPESECPTCTEPGCGAEPMCEVADIPDLLAAAAERDALAAAVERVRALHGPRVLQVLGATCSAEECDHEDACPLVDYTVCGHCYDVGDGAHPYAYEEGGLQDVAHPCATRRALDTTPDTGGES